MYEPKITTPSLDGRQIMRAKLAREAKERIYKQLRNERALRKKAEREIEKLKQQIEAMRALGFGQ